MVFGIVVLACLAIGCSVKGNAECRPSQEAYQKAVRAGDFDEARKLRNAAYEKCSATEALSKIDLALVEGETAKERRAAVLATRTKETNDFIRLFLDFVAQNRQAPQRASVSRRCVAVAADAGLADAGAVLADAGDALADEAMDEATEDAEDEEEADEVGDAGFVEDGRLCTSTRKVGQQQLIQVRYDENRLNVFRFSITPGTTLDCSRVSGRPSKEWLVPVGEGKTVKRWRCDLAGPLAGLAAVVTDNDQASLHVFSHEYVDRDPELTAILKGP